MVEDETDVRELASEFLREGGYTVLEAHDGEAALGIVRNHGTSIHLLLTDVVMPRMNGRDLAQKVYELRPDIRVMFMTGYADFPDTHERQQKFEVGILQKPFSRSTLLEKMHKIMKSTPHTIA